MSEKVVHGQILLEDSDVKKIADDYLSGRTTLDKAVSQLPRKKVGILDTILKIVLPIDLYEKSRVG